MRTLSSSTLYEQIAVLTGVPAEELSDIRSLLKRLPQLREKLRSRLIGQDKAVECVTNALRARLIRTRATAPVLSLLCVGPSGVGKTETALQLAKVCFGGSDTLVRLDGSEYGESHTISRLLGAPPGYVGFGAGGQLTEPVRRKPRSVVLFDEIEKAAPEVLNSLLQVMSAGRLTDAMGQTVDFRRAIVVLTSNLGNKATSVIPQREIFEAEVKEAVRAALPPEFIGRLDAMVIYHHLLPDLLEQIIRLKLADLAASTRGILSFEPTGEAMRKLSEEAYSPGSGAREIDRVLRERVDPAIAFMAEKELLDEKRPVKIRIDFDKGDFVFALADTGIRSGKRTSAAQIE